MLAACIFATPRRGWPRWRCSAARRPAGKAKGKSVKVRFLQVHDVDEAIFLSDRIYVMSARPGTIMADIRVPFGRDREFAAVTRSPEAAEIEPRVLKMLGYGS